MDISNIRFDERAKTIDILTSDHKETVESVQYLIDNKLIGDNDFQSASFTYRGEPRLVLSSIYTAKPYKTVIIHSINFNSVYEGCEYSSDVSCAVTILKMLNLYVFDSIKSILLDKNTYNTLGGYTILVDKSGLFRWETRYGAQFIYD